MKHLAIVSDDLRWDLSIKSAKLMPLGVLISLMLFSCVAERDLSVPVVAGD